MEKHPITISYDKDVHPFEVSEHPHHDGERCKYRVFENGMFVASFEHDAQNCLHICQNAAGLTSPKPIEIESFVDIASVNPIYYEPSYYTEPATKLKPKAAKSDDLYDQLMSSLQVKKGA
jgi:hypothetical protein